MNHTMRKSSSESNLLAALARGGLAGIVLMTIASAASAQAGGGGGGGGGERRGPPPEAIAACKSLASDAACTFTGPQGSAVGTCFSPQAGLALACRPKNAPTGAAPGSK